MSKNYNYAAQPSGTEIERKRKTAEEEPVKDVNPCTLTLTNFKHVDQITITSMMVNLISFKLSFTFNCHRCFCSCMCAAVRARKEQEAAA
jgi:hypothetical protein